MPTCPSPKPLSRCFANYAKVNVKWVAADKCETEEGAAAALDQVDGIVVPGASASVASTAKIGALEVRP